MNLQLMFRHKDLKEETHYLANENKLFNYRDYVKYNDKWYAVARIYIEFEPHPMGTFLVQHVELNYSHDD